MASFLLVDVRIVKANAKMRYGGGLERKYQSAYEDVECSARVSDLCEPTSEVALSHEAGENSRKCGGSSPLDL